MMSLRKTCIHISIRIRAFRGRYRFTVIFIVKIYVYKAIIIGIACHVTNLK